jgi:hypothetical protein
MSNRYTGYKHIIRISHENEAVLHSLAEEIAITTATRWNMQGANVTFGQGFWRPENEAVFKVEFGANIEIVTDEMLTNEDLQVLRNHVTAVGLTAYVTVETVAAHELY